MQNQNTGRHYGPIEKANEATLQRPAGTRPLNAPLLVLDLL